MRHTQDSNCPNTHSKTVATPAPPADGADYRKALSCFATGVTVVTTHWQGQDWGMTCNSFNSVSLNPRLVLWSIRRESSSLAAFTQGGASPSVCWRSRSRRWPDSLLPAA